MPNLIKCVALIATAALAACAWGPPTEPTRAPALIDVAKGVANTTVRAEFGGRVVDADTGGPVGNVEISLSSIAGGGRLSWGFPKDPAMPTSAADGTFTLSLDLPSSWHTVWLKLTGPPGYDDREQEFDRETPADRPTIRIYPTLMVRPGESIDVRVDPDVWCGSWDWTVPCRRVVVAASADEAVELEIVARDSTKPMAIGMVSNDWDESLTWDLGDMSVHRLVVPAGWVPYVLGAGTARLTARR